MIKILEVLIQINQLIGTIITAAGNLTKSASESSLSDACETTSAKETARSHEEKDTCSDNDDTRAYQDVPDDARAYPERPEDARTTDSCDEKSYDNEKDVDEDKDDEVESRNKLQKQGNVVLRRKSKCNPLFRKSKWFTISVYFLYLPTTTFAWIPKKL